MRSAGPKWADVIVAVALLLVATPLVIAVAQAYDEADARIVCQTNLRNIGYAVLLYANSLGYHGQFPRTHYDMKDPKPTWGTPYAPDGTPGAQPAEAIDLYNPAKSKFAPAANDVTAPLFLLLRTQEIEPDSFVCPSTGQTPLDYGGGKNTAMNWSNWPGSKSIRDHLSYSYINPYPSDRAIASGWKFDYNVSSELPIAADMNPGTPALLKLRPDDAPAVLAQGNSLNHYRHGQNVLFADGHVSFHTTPFVGIGRDNLYTFGKTGFDERDKMLPGGGEGIVGPSAWVGDAVLLPTARDLGMCDDAGVPVAEIKQRQEAAAKAMHPRTAQEIEELLKNFVGNYRMGRDEDHVTLEVTKDSLKLSSPLGAGTYTFQVIDIRPKRMRIAVTGKDISPRNDSWLKLTRSGMEIDSSDVEILKGKWQRQ